MFYRILPFSLLPSLPPPSLPPSLLPSSPEVGSSRKMTLGNLSSCRATASRLFCPPLSPGPVAPPTTVSARSNNPLWRVTREQGRGEGGGGREGGREERQGGKEAGRERGRRRGRQGGQERGREGEREREGKEGLLATMLVLCIHSPRP